MKELSTGATAAWQIAAAEAGGAKHQYIEKEHLLIGIYSLEKVLMAAGQLRLDPRTVQALRTEYRTIDCPGIYAAQLRRQIRSKLGAGNYQHTGNVIHRSETCKNIFKRADELAVSLQTFSCLHLLAALLEDPGDTISSVLHETGVNLPDLQEHVQTGARKWEFQAQNNPETQDDPFHLPANLSQEAARIIALARQESERLMHYYLGTEHIFIALTRIENGLTQAALRKVNFDPEQLVSKIRDTLVRGDGHRYWEGLWITPRSRTVLTLADQEARLRNSQIEEQDILLGILKEGAGIPVRAALAMNCQEMIRLIENGEVKAGQKKIPAVEPEVTPGSSFLEKYGRDLTRQASEGRLDEIIGRRDELLELIRILTRKTKNNPVLIGEAGVGKTAIVEGLAFRIASGNLTPELIGRRVIELDMTAIVAGTRYRGDFEERMTRIIQEASRPDIILFIDEIHTLMGAGAAEGAQDASNILKPALARGDIKCIGATTTKEYRQYIEKDAALERRFQPVTVEEPGIKDTYDILTGLRAKYEAHHNVTISDAAIQAAVDLSARYLPDRRLPDKAIDLLDTACSNKKVPDLSMKGNMPENESLIVSEEDIAGVVSQWTGIPVAKLTEEEQTRLAHLEEFLQTRVVGQDEAVQKVTRRIRMAKAGLLSHDRPIGVFLFLGPSGVGKTELAKRLSVFLFNSERHMIRLDMSEYMEKHTVSRLIGAPPGYIGYEEEGQLTGALRKKPHSVVLLDEVEKAHPDVFDLFLQVFDEGRLTDAKGRTVDAKNAIFIMTSNIGSETYFNQPEIDRQAVQQKVQSVFRPEFLNRIDETIVFNPLGLEHIHQIARIMLGELSSRLKGSGIGLQFDQHVIEFICGKYYDPAYGARPLGRQIENLITYPISEKILSGTFTRGDVIAVSVKDGEIAFEKGGQ
jgi:ATP-dependent Clp protease ATP-binding subunit ClpC